MAVAATGVVALPGSVQTCTVAAAELGSTDQVGVIILPTVASEAGRLGWWMMGGLLGLVGLGRVIGSQKMARLPFSLGGLKGSASLFSLVARIEDWLTPVDGAFAIREAALGVAVCRTGRLMKGRVVVWGVGAGDEEADDLSSAAAGVGSTEAAVAASDFVLSADADLLSSALGLAGGEIGDEMVGFFLSVIFGFSGALGFSGAFGFSVLAALALSSALLGFVSTLDLSVTLDLASSFFFLSASLADQTEVLGLGGEVIVESLVEGKVALALEDVTAVAGAVSVCENGDTVSVVTGLVGDAVVLFLRKGDWTGLMVVANGVEIDLAPAPIAFLLR